jgi:hypothetical protein
MWQPILVKLPNIKFNENHFSGFQVALYIQQF